MTPASAHLSGHYAALDRNDLANPIEARGPERGILGQWQVGDSGIGGGAMR